MTRDFCQIEKDQRKQETIKLYNSWDEMIAELFEMKLMTGVDMQAFFKKLNKSTSKEIFSHKIQTVHFLQGE